MEDVANHEYFMRQALNEAKKAANLGEVPIGAIVVLNEDIVASAYNKVEGLKNPTAHAEILAIRRACASLKNKYLINATIYVTIEPCAMCTWALILSRIGYLVYGAEDKRTGACGGILDLVNRSKLNHKIKVTRGVLASECQALIQNFFRNLRIRSTKENRKYI
ncbi:MAG: tRNA adenosine(34) deaminase TadA [bacterium]|nr:tRNA adenosine(34) deaminase TadA [bacterium]